MYSENHDSNKHEDVEHGSNERAAAVGSESLSSSFPGGAKSSPISRQSTSQAQIVFEKLPGKSGAEGQAPALEKKDAQNRHINTRWRFFAAGSALVLVLLTVAGIYLLTKQPSTVDNIVITTVPSGADVRLDSSGYGLSPVKLEHLEKGTYLLTITKEGFEPVIDRITLSESDHQFEYKLKPIPPPEVAGLSLEDKIKFHQNKLEEALALGHYGIPYEGSAHYYAELILLDDPSNEYATKKLDDIRMTAQRMAKEAIARGDLAQAQEINRFIRNYYNQSQEMARRQGQYAGATPKAEEPVEPNSDASNVETTSEEEVNYRREQGLDKYSRGRYAEAIPHLEFAMLNGRGTTDVIVALAHSHLKLGQYGKAEGYFLQVSPSNDDSYRSTIAALGDIAARRGDTATALEKYRQARQLGGSALYTIQMLDDRIERIERPQREKAAQPVPLTVQAKHQHGSLRGSCRGTLTVDSTGVRYDGSEHNFSWNLLSVGVRVGSDGLRIVVQGKSEEFKVDRSSAEQFRETVTRYQQPYAPGNQ